jgi:hypothetical protein
VNYPRCATCAHWSRNDEPRIPNRRYGQCRSDKWSDFGDYADSDGVEIKGIYDDSAIAETGEEFGCIHHKAKETQQ